MCQYLNKAEGKKKHCKKKNLGKMWGWDVGSRKDKSMCDM